MKTLLLDGGASRGRQALAGLASTRRPCGGGRQLREGGREGGRAGTALHLPRYPPRVLAGTVGSRKWPAGQRTPCWCYGPTPEEGGESERGGQGQSRAGRDHVQSPFRCAGCSLEPLPPTQRPQAVDLGTPPPLLLQSLSSLQFAGCQLFRQLQLWAPTSPFVAGKQPPRWQTGPGPATRRPSCRPSSARALPWSKRPLVVRASVSGGGRERLCWGGGAHRVDVALYSRQLPQQADWQDKGRSGWQEVPGLHLEAGRGGAAGAPRRRWQSPSGKERGCLSPPADSQAGRCPPDQPDSEPHQGLAALLILLGSSCPCAASSSA